MKSRIWSKLIFASCVGYFDRAHCGFYMASCSEHGPFMRKKKSEAAVCLAMRLYVYYYHILVSVLSCVCTSNTNYLYLPGTGTWYGRVLAIFVTTVVCVLVCTPVR